MPFLSTSAAVPVYCRRLLLPHIIRSSGRSSRRSSSQLLQLTIHQNYDNSIRSIRLFSTSPSATTSTLTSPDNDSAARVSNRKPRVVILGSGWAGFTLARRLDKSIYDVRVISPANHFLFTPLLPSTAVGTLEFRAIQEPVRTIQGLDEYYQAKALRIMDNKKLVVCEDLYKKTLFNVSYDFLCVAGGMKSNTFNTPNVERLEGVVVFFLKHLYHARQIRNRILECFERASNPTIEYQIK